MDPSIKWYQTQTSVIITVDLNNITDHEVIFETKKTSIKCKVDDVEYVKILDLNNEINTELSRSELTNILKIHLSKKETKIWDKLTETKKSNVFIDWTNWNFIDEVPSNIKDNIVNNNIKEALTTLNIPKVLSDLELINSFNLSDSD